MRAEFVEMEERLEVVGARGLRLTLY